MQKKNGNGRNDNKDFIVFSFITISGSRPSFICSYDMRSFKSTLDIILLSHLKNFWNCLLLSSYRDVPLSLSSKLFKKQLNIYIYICVYIIIEKHKILEIQLQN